MTVHLWEIRSPDGGSAGLEFARARLEAAERVIAHDVPSRIDVWVSDEAGRSVAKGERLEGSVEPAVSRRIS